MSGIYISPNGEKLDGNGKPIGLPKSNGNVVSKPRVVVCSAIRSKNGKVVCGARHWDNVMRGQILIDGKRPAEWLSAEQGFIDQFGVFLTRQEAYTIAKTVGQIKYGKDYSVGTLYSEDLY